MLATRALRCVWRTLGVGPLRPEEAVSSDRRAVSP